MTEITENFIDLKTILEAKHIKTSPLVVRLLNRLLHVRELNQCIYLYRDRFGVDFARAITEEYLSITTELIGAEHIPATGNPIIAGNHPLGGPDGMELIAAVGQYRRDIKFPVNDFLLYLPGLKECFIPVDKVHRNGKAITALEDAFAGQNAMLYFPAGLCSRKQGKEVRDLEWKPTFVKKAVQYHRDIVPVFVGAQNRRRFYRIANLRKRIGIKFNFEMALLPGEMFAQKGKTHRIVVGAPIPWQTFTPEKSWKEWAALLREHVYALRDNPEARFLKG